MTNAIRALAASAVGAFALAVVSPPCLAATPHERAGVLEARAHLTLVGAPFRELAYAGDVNRDGRPDLIVGAPGATVAGFEDAGVSYVVFGQRDRRRVDVRRLGDAGFAIEGSAPALPLTDVDGFGQGDESGSRVDGLGDVNGDGYDDVAIGGPGASSRLRAAEGAVHVVFGGPGTETVHLGDLGDRGYRIDGDKPFDTAGSTVAAGGDVNGDGRGDVLIAVRRLAYVVFGQSRPEAIDLRDLGPHGYRISGPSGERNVLSGMVRAGDVNGDGLADQAIGQPGVGSGGRVSVLFGKRDIEPVDLGALAGRGYVIDGAGRGGRIGGLMAPVGDMNGDGRPDLVLDSGEVLDDPGAAVGVQYALVVFGQSGASTIDLSRPGDRAQAVGGLPYSGGIARDFGLYAAAAGDLNGDGLADVALGQPNAPRGCYSLAGSAFVVFGSRRAPDLSLSALPPSAGYRLNGRLPLEGAGTALAGAGDLTGDGRSELAVLSPGQADPDEGNAVVTVAAGIPPDVLRRPSPTKDACFSLRVPHTTIGAVLRRGGLLVRLRDRDVGPGLRSVFISASLSQPGFPDGEGLSVAGVRVRFSRPGVRTARLQLTRAGRRLLARRTRVRLHVEAQQGSAGIERVAARAIVLRR